jgi:hypothetical protein
MSLQALILLVEILGKCACGHMGRNRNSGKAIDEAWYLRVAQAGTQALSNWPRNFHHLLGELVASSENADESLEQLYEVLYKNSTARDRFSFVKNAIMEYRNERHENIDPRHWKSVGTAIQERKLLSLHQYAMLANADVRAVRKAIDLGIVKAKKVLMQGTIRYFIDIEASPPELAKQSGETYSLRKTARFLGLSGGIVSQLRTLGSLRPTHIPVPPTCYRIEDLRSFQEALLKRAGSMDIRDYDANMHIRLNEMKARQGLLWRSKADVIHAILKGEIAPAGRVGDSMHDIVLFRSDVERRKAQLQDPTKQ